MHNAVNDAFQTGELRKRNANKQLQLYSVALEWNEQLCNR